MAAPDGRVVLLVVSPRVAPGLLSWAGWQRLSSADVVLAAEPDEGWLPHLAEAGVRVVDVAALPVAQRAGRLLDEAPPGREVVWLGSADGDPGLTDALAEHLARRAVAARPPEVELLTGSHDVPGSRLLDLVAVMDRLRSPGGCPWDAEQTHTSLLPYLLEEAHEVVEAVENGDRDHLVEELGDLLLQVMFHARVAEDHPEQPFDVDDVAAGIVEKLVRRHPHVFAEVQVDGVDEVSRNWEDIKAAEKRRRGVFDGVPLTLPALARAQKMLARLDRSALDAAARRAALEQAVDGDEVAAVLLDAVAEAASRADDAEGVLRRALARLAAAVPRAEAPPGEPDAEAPPGEPGAQEVAG